MRPAQRWQEKTRVERSTEGGVQKADVTGSIIGPTLPKEIILVKQKMYHIYKKLKRKLFSGIIRSLVLLHTWK